MRRARAAWCFSGRGSAGGSGGGGPTRPAGSWGGREGGGPTRPACSRGSREGGGAPFSKGRNSGRSEDRSERARAERSRGVHQPRGQGREGWPPVLVHGARRRGRRPRTRWGRPRQGPRGARGDPQGGGARQEGPDLRAAEGYDDPL